MTSGSGPGRGREHVPSAGDSKKFRGSRLRKEANATAI